MAKAESTTQKKKDTNIPAKKAAPQKRSRVTKSVTQSDEAAEMNSTAAKAANRKGRTVKRTPVKKEKGAVKNVKKAPAKKTEVKKATGIITKVKSKIASAGHALADKIRSDKKD